MKKKIGTLFGKVVVTGDSTMTSPSEIYCKYDNGYYTLYSINASGILECVSKEEVLKKTIETPIEEVIKESNIKEESITSKSTQKKIKHILEED